MLLSYAADPLRCLQYYQRLSQVLDANKTISNFKSIAHFFEVQRNDLIIQQVRPTLKFEEKTLW